MIIYSSPETIEPWQIQEASRDDLVRLAEDLRHRIDERIKRAHQEGYRDGEREAEDNAWLHDCDKCGLKEQQIDKLQGELRTARANDPRLREWIDMLHADRDSLSANQQRAIEELYFLFYFA